MLSAGKRFHKTDFYSVFPPLENPDIFGEIREDVHAQKKRMAAVPYSMSNIQLMYGFVDDTIDLLLLKLDGLIATATLRNGVDLGDWLHYFAFDVLGEIAFGKKFGFLDAGFDIEGTIRTIDNSQLYNGIVGQMPFMDRLLRHNPLWNYVPFLAAGNALITRKALQEVQERMRSNLSSDRTDLLGQLLEAHQAQPDKFSEADVFAVAYGAM